MMHVHRGVARRLRALAVRLELLGLLPDVVLLHLVAFDLLPVPRLLLAGGEGRAELSEILLAALRLVKVPLVRRFGLADRRIVLVQQSVVLGGTGHVPEERAEGCED